MATKRKKKSYISVTMIGNCWNFISCYFTQFLNKLNLKKYYTIHKNLHRIYRAIQNWSNLFFSAQGFVLIFLNILTLLLKLNNDFKYFIHINRTLKWGFERGVDFLTHKYILILIFKLISPNICFISHCFIWDT